MILIDAADFVATATKPDQWPKGLLAETAFVGRSNVGKSSMINALVNRRKLVRVSNTPGRTRTLNFFEVALRDGLKKYRVRLCDLPGYGFAKASKTERAQWQEMIEGYLTARNDLRVVVVIVDAYVGPTEDDRAMIDFVAGLPPRILVAATKIDKLNKAARKPKLEQIRKDLELPEGAVQGFSATEPLGVTEVWQALLSGIKPVD
jgi:GTP-binding protein